MSQVAQLYANSLEFQQLREATKPTITSLGKAQSSSQAARRRGDLGGYRLDSAQLNCHVVRQFIHRSQGDVESSSSMVDR